MSIFIALNSQSSFKNMIDAKEYYRITNCTPNLTVPIEYTPEEAQAFLQKLGYKIVVHFAPIKQVYRNYEDNVYYKEEIKVSVSR